MRYSFAVIAAIAAHASAHGVITEIQGANGVNMPGLSVIDGTPRDCPTPGCGSEADTSIIRKNAASPLGKTQGGGAVSAAAAISSFMGTGATAGTKRQLFGKPKGKGNAAAAAGTKTPKGTVEQGVAAAAGTGASSGLPTAADDGTITMTFHQVNQDGAGPLTAAIDPTSGGTSAAAFQPATVTQDVPGIGIGGLSGASVMDFPVKVQMPAGMTCSGTVGGATNVCVVKMQNAALAGPFGGSAAFTQSTAARKRAIEYNLRKRHMARGILGKPE